MANEKKGFQFRGSPLHRVLQVLPTPVRPWLLAYDVISEARYQFSERRHGRREASLIGQLAKAKAQRGSSLRTMVIGAGLAYAAQRLWPTVSATPKLRVSGFVDEAITGAKAQLDKVQALADDGFVQARNRIGSAARED